MKKVTYQACYALARKLGCIISREDTDLETIWVWGPDEVYEWTMEHHFAAEVHEDDPGPREDPCEDGHFHCGWDSVWYALQTYRIDLHFHRFGISSANTEAILIVADKSLLHAWLDRPDETDRALVLADWLEENGHNSAGAALRTVKK